MSLGLIIILIAFLGYASNWLNWRYLNHRITRFLYYVGTFVHESSHAALCVITGAKIYEFKVFTSAPHVTHEASRPPFIREFLISSAPIFGGLLFLFLVNRYVLGDSFAVAPFAGQWKDVLLEPLKLLAQIRPLEWQSWVMIALFVNAGAMIGPSLRDIKNIWPVLAILLFVQFPPLLNLCLVALSLILVNIAIQVVAILSLQTFLLLKKIVAGRD